MSSEEEGNAFYQWYNGLVGFHITSERILEDLEREVDVGAIQPERLERWMKVCWNNAVEATLNEAQHYDWEYAPSAAIENILDTLKAP